MVLRYERPSVDMSGGPFTLTLQGAAGLQKRLEAIRSSQGNRAMMQGLGRAVANRAIKNAGAHRKTGDVQRGIRVTDVSDHSVTIESQSGHGLVHERGSRPHIIRPRNAKVLRFAASSAGQRLSGSARRGAAVVFAKVVRHPGTKAYPYMEPAARDTIRDSGLVTESIIARWNRAD